MSTTPKEGAALPSSPTLQEDYTYQGQNGSKEAVAQDCDHVETRDSIYTTPSILGEDEDDPYSHAAMTRRAEEILANAKKRLTVRPGVDPSLGKRLLTQVRTWRAILVGHAVH